MMETGSGIMLFICLVLLAEVIFAKSPQVVPTLVSCEYATKSGVYQTKIGTEKKMVCCETDAIGFKWTVIQRRGQYGDKNDYFHRNWTDYKNGFGDLEGQFWLGLQALHELTDSRGSQLYELMIVMEDFEGNSLSVQLGKFAISNDAGGYAITYSTIRPNNVLKNGIPNKGTKFSTFDQDNDGSSTNCARTHKGAWWYSNCTASNLNGIYWGGKHESYADGVNYFGFHNFFNPDVDPAQDYLYSLKSTVMKIRQESQGDILTLFSCDNAPMSGVYKTIIGTEMKLVYCEIDSEGFKWTVIQRRGQFGEENDYFYRNWTEYKNGFGEPKGQLWLGLEALHQLTGLEGSQQYELKIDLTDFEGNSLSVQLGRFSISNEAGDYALTYSRIDADNILKHGIPKNGTKFSTKDMDNDDSYTNCAQIHKGAWWYSNCTASNLNGIYRGGNHESYADGVNYFGFHKFFDPDIDAAQDYHYSLMSTIMKIRPLPQEDIPTLASCDNATTSGVYKTQIDTEIKLVYCEIDSEGFKWTLIQRRGEYGDKNDYFYKNWAAYKEGFGYPKGQLWLGLEALHQLTGLEDSQPYELKIDMTDFKGKSLSVRLGAFRISNEAGGYAITYSLLSPENIFKNSIPKNGSKFSTKDMDNDDSSTNCAKTHKGAWWYSNCTASSLNGIYWGGKHESYADGVNYFGFHTAFDLELDPYQDLHYSLKTTVMKIRVVRPEEVRQRTLVSCEYATESGVYRLLIGTEKKLVHCEKDLTGYRWTIIQRRGQYGDKNDYFYRNWTDYKNGFGDPEGQVWLGLDTLHQLTGLEKSQPYQLIIYMEDFEGRSLNLTINRFQISDEDDDYAISFSSVQSDFLLSLALPKNGAKFSTKDKDNDHSSKHCARVHKGAWWYSNCSGSNLNGIYWAGEHSSYADGINYLGFHKFFKSRFPYHNDYHYSLKSTVMKIRKESQQIFPNLESCDNATKSGVYLIQIGTEKKHVYCEIDSDGFKWTVIQRRGQYGDPEDYFLRKWVDYKYGFGDPKGQLWLGLEALYQLTGLSNSQTYQLQIYMENFEGQSVNMTFYGFYIRNEYHKYQINYSDVFPRSLRAGAPIRAAKFSTIDQDNDESSENCAWTQMGAWWYSNCARSNLNGIYWEGPHESYADGVNYFGFHAAFNSRFNLHADLHYSLKTTVMKITPENKTDIYSYTMRF